MPPGRELFGPDRLQQAIAAAAGGGAHAVRDAVVAAVDLWLGGSAQHDDMTLVVAERVRP